MVGLDDAALAGGLIAATWVYHRLFDTSPPVPPPQKVQLPRTDAGAPYPLLYGQCRVKTPILAWASPVIAFHQASGDSIDGDYSAPTDRYLYFMDMFYVIGIPFDGGTNNIVSVFVGDQKMLPSIPLTTLTGNGNFEDGTRLAFVSMPTGTGEVSGAPSGTLEFLNGNSSQTLYASGSPTTEAGKYMTTTTSTGNPTWQELHGVIDGTLVPAYRGFMSAFFYNQLTTSSHLLTHFLLGASASVPQIGFEVTSFSATPKFGDLNNQIADLHSAQDSNPAFVIYDLLTGTKGKLALPTSRIDTASFQAAADTLHGTGELNGFSRAWDGTQTAGEMIGELLRQIDGVLYEDPVSGLIKLKLIRADYTVSSLPWITPDNCNELQNFAMGGWTGVPNKVRVAFTNRADSYRDGSAVAHNQANAVDQDGEVREVQLQFPGVCNQELANNIAARELAARSRPLMKCRAIVNRSFYTVCPGDAVRVSWPEWGLSNVVFRVGAVDRGSLENGQIALDLIQDYFYVWRFTQPVAPGLPPLKTPGSFAH
jgi:hypothetical protein